MSSTETRRYISLREAANIVGPRFYKAWSDTDPDALGRAREIDPEAHDRAEAVQYLLKSYIVDGDITAYQDPPPDGSGRPVIDIPAKWYEAASFNICIRTSRFFVFTDAWEPIYIKPRQLLAHLPKIAGQRNPGRYHAKDVIHAAWKMALSQEAVPTKAELTRLLIDWCAEKGLYPDPTTFDDITAEVVGFLNENKTEPRVSDFNPSHDLPPNPA
ncbi:hypothetical protein TomTYG75_26070 [Sphingobium sp. TomTYG75]